MPQKKYVVSLSPAERWDLLQFSHTGKAAAYAITHARILLQADIASTEGRWVDSDISAALKVSVATIERVRQRCVEEGIDACLKQRPRVRTRLLDGEQEAHLVALTCSPAPEGRARWTLRWLRDRLVALEIVETISHETVRQTLKKTS